MINLDDYISTMKGHKNKGKKKELESLPPSSLVLACLLPPQCK
jgi:hypothetical protein